MKKFTYEEFFTFLASDKDELDYFGCNKQDLITLYEYLNKLKIRNNLYNELIDKPLKSIKNKNKWVKNIVPARDVNPEGLAIYGRFDSMFTFGIEENDYINIGGCYSMPLIFDSLKYRARILDNSQEEMHEINKVAHTLGFDVNKISTASDNFSIDNSFFGKCCVDIGNLTLTKVNIEDNKASKTEHFVKKGPFHIREGILPIMLNETESENLVRKLYIKDKNI